VIKLVDLLNERCQKGYKTHPTRKTKKMYGKTYRNCIKAEGLPKQTSDNEFKTPDYMDVREDNIEDTWPNDLDEDLRAWFGKGGKGSSSGGGWDRYNTKGEKIGKCGDRKKGEGKPKCLSKRDARRMTKKQRAAAVRKKRREDPNPNRRGKAKNVSSKTRTRKKRRTKKSKKK
jgi:hypothetical protein|tara:strand:+ start:4535 stop:5053 length:519 start_codon:yes stop_codon:yes gene_type:complete